MIKIFRFYLIGMLLVLTSYAQVQNNPNDSLSGGDTISVPNIDSLSFTTDSITNDSIVIKPKKKSSQAIDAPIDYHGSDSTRLDLKNKKMYLYGNAFIHYGDMGLLRNL